MEETILKIDDLHAYYTQVPVLHGISLEVARGGITAVLGANGAGKTTLLRAICGTIRTEGSITMAGRPIQGLNTEDIVRQGIAHVPDGRGTFTELTVRENLELGAYTRRDRQRVKSDYELVYELFPVLRERLPQQAGTLSGGEQQMLAIGRAIMLRPKLMLLDEPSFGLAPRIVESLFEALKRINAEEKMSLLLIEQNAAKALALADLAYLIETGRIVQSGEASKLQQDESVRRAYLGY